MCDEICKTCGGDNATAEIGRRLGFRPDIAFREIKRLETKIHELIKYGEGHLAICPHDYAVKSMVETLKDNG